MIPYGAMKAFLRIASINIGIFLAGLVLAELIFGNWLFGPSYGLMNLPRNERRLIDVSQFVPDGGVIRYTRDEYGLRGDYGGDPTNIDVLALGGSTTDERYITDDETWVAQLQARFRAHGKPVTIANGAIDGQSSVGHINALTQWLPKIPELRPKYLIFYLGINDTAVNDTTPTQFDRITSPSRSRQIRQYIANHSALYHLYRTVRGTIQADRAQLLHGRVMRRIARWVPVTEFADPQEMRSSDAHQLDAYASRLKVLSELTRRMGAEPIFVTQTRTDIKMQDGLLSILLMPDRDGRFPTQGSNAGLVKLELFNETTLAVCAELKLTCVDLAAKIDFAEEDFYDAIHTTPKGSKKIAEFLYDALADKIKLSRRVGS
jgi:lysophospholipase L1-like esterase